MTGQITEMVHAGGEDGHSITLGRIIRAKWVMDGAGTLPDAAAKLREFADQLDRMHGEGWTLEQPVNDDYGLLVPPAAP
jgi:hypothetical protein